MHELSIAKGVLDIVRSSVGSEELGDVRIVHLRLGEMADVVCDSLNFSFRSITAGTSLDRAALAIEHIPYRIHCQQCDMILEQSPGYGICPRCGGGRTSIVSGTELQVVSIEMGEEEVS